MSISVQQLSFPFFFQNLTPFLKQKKNTMIKYQLLVFGFVMTVNSLSTMYLFRQRERELLREHTRQARAYYLQEEDYYPTPSRPRSRAIALQK